jgi:hypothetical protein
MKLTITIEDEQGATTLVERPGPALAAPPRESGAQAETEATSAGGPPAWLVEQLHEGESQAEPAGAGGDEALDAGAAKASGNGLVSMPG